MLLGQTELATQEGGFLAAFIDFSKVYDRVCMKKLWECLRGCEWEAPSNATGIVP